jgi:hypothetical protein
VSTNRTKATTQGHGAEAGRETTGREHEEGEGERTDLLLSSQVLALPGESRGRQRAVDQSHHPAPLKRGKQRGTGGKGKRDTKGIRQRGEARAGREWKGEANLHADTVRTDGPDIARGFR